MTTSAVRYICTPGARYHVRPLTLMQHEVLYLCTYSMTLPMICQASWYPPIQVVEVLAYLMQHGLVKSAPARGGESWQRA
jgi:hypothetical protein